MKKMKKSKSAWFTILMTVVAIATISITFQRCSDDDVHGPVTVVDSIGGDFLFDNLRGIAVDANGNVYVVYSDWRIYKISPEDEATEFINIHERSGQPYTELFGIAVGADGNIYVTDKAIDKIWKIVINSGGTTSLTSFGYVFNDPEAVAADVNGNVYVTDWGSSAEGDSKVWKLSPNASVVELADVGQSPGVAVHNDGTVYVADRGENRVMEIPENGTAVTLVEYPLIEWPYGVGIDDAKNVYVTDDNKVKKIDTNGNVSTLADDFPFELPRAIAVDNKGTVYLADNSRKKIYKIITK